MTARQVHYIRDTLGAGGHAHPQCIPQNHHAEPVDEAGDSAECTGLSW